MKLIEKHRWSLTGRAFTLALALLVLLLGSRLSLATTDPVVDGRLDSQYVFLQAYTTIPSDPKNEPAPGVLYGYEGTDTCYWAFVIDRGFNDNVYVPDGSDDAYMKQDGWVKSDGSVQDHRFDNLHKSDKAQFTITGPSGSHAFYLDLLHQTNKNSTNPNDYISGFTGNDNSNSSDPYVNAAATSTHWNILNSGWSQWYDRSPTDFNYNTNSGNYWEWQIIYEFSIPKSALSGLGINSGCGDMAMTDAHNSPSKYVNTLGSIGDYVWHDANSNGQQDDGGAAAGIPNVTLYLKQNNTVVRTTSTAPDGSYSFVNLFAGAYVVDVDESTLPSGYTLTTNNEPLTVNLSSGQNYKDADFGYNDQRATVGDRVWLDANENGIQDSGEVGVPGVTVKLLNSSGVEINSTTTDSSGLYTFAVAPGTYEVQFVLPPAYRFAPQNQGGNDAVDSDADASTGKTGTFSVANNQHKNDVDAGLIRNPDVCYAVADGTTSANDSSQLDTLAFLDRLTGATAAVGGGVGNTGRYNIEAIAFQPGGAVLFAADADRLGVLDLTTGAFTAKPQAFGTGGGSAGNITFDDVDGLTFDPTTGKLYGTHRRSGPDLLFQIDPSTGAHVPNAFGSGKDYVKVAPVASLEDVDDIAVDPVSGVMYATVNNGGSSDDHLVIVNKSTGGTTDVGIIKLANNTKIQDIEGLAFFNDGKLYGSSGKNGPTTNALYQIDPSNAQATYIGSFTEPLRDFEGLACLTASSTVVVDKSAQPSQVSAGDQVSFTIRITNTGTADIGILPLKDMYDASKLQFVSATPTQSSVSGGVVLWNDLTAGAPNGFGQNLAPNQAFQVTVRFQAIAATRSGARGVLSTQNAASSSSDTNNICDDDFDNDGIDNNADTDDDNDGIPDSVDTDDDNDGIPDDKDIDDDNDGITDDKDTDQCICSDDFDHDGQKNSVDTDDDNDGIPDVSDPDDDNDGIPDDVDNDDDNDGIIDRDDNDQCVCDADYDNDGIPNNLDNDDDNDGILDSSDTDDDNDGIDDIHDDDDDNDGIHDSKDDDHCLCSTDQDNDGIPDNVDTDDDNDGISDDVDNDDDNDGIPDDMDDDDDNDGIVDSKDGGVSCPVPSAAIGDRVYYDLNGDGGLDNDGEPGLNGVTVNLYQGSCPGSGSPFKSMVTSGNGGYAFTDLAAGTYCVNVDDSTLPSGLSLTTGNEPLQKTLAADEKYWLADFGYRAQKTGETCDLAAVDGAKTTPGGNVPSAYDQACVGITAQPDYTITKVNNTDPDLHGVPRGEVITFTVQITNTGNVPITVLPLRDTYVDQFLTFIGATPAHNQFASGQVDWTDLTAAGASGFGVDLAPGQVFTVVVEFVGRGDTSLLPGGVTTNTVTVVNGFYDPDGDGPAGPKPLPQKSAQAPAKVLAQTAVDLANRTLTVAPDGVEVAWQTVSEANLVSFNVYREAAGQEMQPVATGIKAVKAGQTSGSSYTILDADAPTGVRIRYYLGSVDVNGDESLTLLGEVFTGIQIYLPVTVR